MNTKRYLIITNSDHSGGSKSQKKGSELFHKISVKVDTIQLSSFRATLSAFLFGKQLKMVSINYDSSIKDFIKMKLNKLVLKTRVGKLDHSIVDGLLPISLRDIEILNIGSVVIRSSCKCFSWTSRPQKLNYFAGQIRTAKNWVCASNLEADIWREKLQISQKPVVQYLTPMQLPNHEITLDLGETSPFVLLSVGNIGPRKGVDRFLEKLDSFGKKIKIRILGKGKTLRTDFQNIIVETEYLEINLCQSVKFAVRVFPSYSECFSRAQFEAVLSGDPTLIFTAGSDPEINQFLPKNAVCENIDILSSRVIENIEKFHVLERRDTSNAEAFYKQTQQLAFTQLQKI